MIRNLHQMKETPPEAMPPQEPSGSSIPKERHDLRILRAIRRIIRSTDQHSRWLAGEYGVTVPQLLCLMKVVESGPLTVKAIADEIYLSSSTLVGIIDRLEKRDYVRRQRSTDDRRQVHVSATEAGRELIRHSPSPLQDNLLVALSKLPELESATIALSLERIVDLLEIKQVPAAPILETAPDLARETTSKAEPDATRRPRRGKASA